MGKARKRTREYRIYNHCRAWDRKKGRQCNVTVTFVKELMKDACCAYCGDKDSKLTLDRIRNYEGHLQHNVVPACEKCNNLRGSMRLFKWLEKIHETNHSR